MLLKTVPCVRCSTPTVATDDSVNVHCDKCWTLKTNLAMHQAIMRGDFNHTIPELNDDYEFGGEE